MMCVKTTVRRSRIHGLGLFADEDIPKGALVWRFTPGFDRRFTAAAMAAFPEPLRSHLATYTWKSTKSGLWCFSADDGKYFNHSEKPNCLSEYRRGEPEVLTFAIRAIAAGEEMTDDYSSFQGP